MLQLNVSLSEFRNYVKNISKSKGEVFNLLKLDLTKMATEFLDTCLNSEIELFLGRAKYERDADFGVGARNHRNGHYQRAFAIKGIGAIKINVPRDRKSLFQSNLLPKYQKIDPAIKEDLALLYITGQSTRNLSFISKHLFGTKISAAEVSKCSDKLSNLIEDWRSRPIADKFKYLYLDGTNFKMRIDKSVEIVNVLVVIGVNEKGYKQVLALQAGDKESANSWRELFKDLKKRGLSKRDVQLGIIDGLPGLEKTFKEEFPLAKVQRCQVHVARNVLSKVPHKIKQKIADDIKSIFYAESKRKSLLFFENFNKKWGNIAPSACKCLAASINSTLTFYSFPQVEWTSLRTTNPIERLNKEFKRRTKSMEIVAGEKSCYNLLVIISLKMEAHWRKRPISYDYKGTLSWLKDGNLHN